MLTIFLIFQFLRSLAISAKVTYTIDARPYVGLDLSQVRHKVTFFSSLFRLDVPKNIHYFRKEPETAFAVKTHSIEGR